MVGYSTLAVAAAATTMLAKAHVYQLDPPSRQLFMGPLYKEWDFKTPDGRGREYCPACMNAKGPDFVRQRAIAKTDPAVLAEYGNGEWPLKWVWEKGELAANGNYLENDEIAKRHGICGDPKQDEMETDNWYGTANSNWPVLETVRQGQVLTIKLGMAAYHWGHAEFFVCNADEMDDPDGIPTQACFNQYPLTRAADDGDASPIDPNYPGRYYVDPECREFETDQTKPEDVQDAYVITARYQLPPELVCERCILQMVYYTGNGCKHEGYEEFNPPSWPSECAPNKEDWIELQRYKCGEGGGDDPITYPEEFWGCSDFAIVADDTAPTPTTPPATPSTPAPAKVTPAPASPPTPSPATLLTSSPTPSPVTLLTSSPVSPPTPSPVPAAPTSPPTPSPVTTTPSPVSPATPSPVAAAPTFTSPPARSPTVATLPPVTEAPVDAGVVPTPTGGGGDSMAKYEYLGCFQGSKGSDGDDEGDLFGPLLMTVEVCYDYCVESGAAFMALQRGHTCWCGAVHSVSDYGDYIFGPPECDSSCSGDVTEACGGQEAYDLYLVLPTSECADPVGPYDQCGGESWEGSTCCSEGHRCTAMGAGGCYSQCRPIEDAGVATPAPTMIETPPEPVMTAAPISGSAPVATTESPVATTESPVATPAPTMIETPPEPVMTAAPISGSAPVATTESPVAVTEPPAAPTTLTEPRNEPGEPNYAPEGALEDDIVKIIPVEGTEPGGLSWADSYSVGDRCYMWTNLDHDIAMVEVYTPIGKMTVETLYETLDPGPGHTGHPLYNDIQCGNGPANSAPDEAACPGLVEHGREGCGQIGPMWDLSELLEQ